MRSEEPLLKEMAYLTLLSIENNASEVEFDRLEMLLQTEPLARRFYFDLLDTYLGLRDPENLKSLHGREDGFENLAMLRVLAEYEKVAPQATCPKEDTPKELIQKVVYPPKQKRKMSRFSIFTLLNAAAILLFLLYLKIAPPEVAVEVATLTDSINAKWVGVEGEMVNGTSIASGDETLFLREGYAELLFGNHAKLTIQGPSEFQVLAEDQVKLAYGRLYAVVPREAIGFTVKTPTAQIVDLGTEFGVDCDFQSDTSLHVMKGKTVLIAGDKSNKVSVEVMQGAAKKISVDTQTISDISCNEHLFVREIDSASNFVWRGQTEISVADIIIGGDGFDKIRSVAGLDPVTGQYKSVINRDARGSDSRYTPVPDTLLIDGVFVPDGGQDRRIVISSLGDTFPCPDTADLVSHEITVYTGAIEKTVPTIPPAVFHGQRYENNIVMIHSNAGITFDLQAIRQSLPGLDVTHFKAFGGVSQALLDVKTQFPDVDFWVLVDGQIRYEKTPVTVKDNAVSFNIALTPQDRFLTLIVTDGSDSTDASRQYAAWNNDFFYLVDPKLGITEALN